MAQCHCAPIMESAGPKEEGRSDGTSSPIHITISNYIARPSFRRNLDFGTGRQSALAVRLPVNVVEFAALPCLSKHEMRLAVDPNEDFVSGDLSLPGAMTGLSYTKTHELGQA